MRHLRYTLLSFIVTATAMLPGHLSAQIALTNDTDGAAFALVADGRAAAIAIDGADAEVVTTAAGMLSSDIEAVSGLKPALTDTPSGTAVIAGTIGQSKFIDKLIADGKLDASAVAGKWEAFGLQVVDHPTDGTSKALVAYGSTPRGTAYALLEVSRIIGVSPYIWWADVVPTHHSRLLLSGTSLTVGEPSVKYRGIFINDEDWGLFPWAAKMMDPERGNIGPNAYARVMELLLRLRANTLWPAMHSCSEAFWANKQNLPVAKRYDIVLGSSHCEQMLRDNEWEWRRYDNNSGTNENWNYVTNKAKIQRYWEERVVESKGYDAMYTMGMRGVHDWGISGYPSTQDKVRGLTEIISYQRSLLDKHIGPAATVPQIFIPYKEVLDAYNAGLQVPDDITLTWVDDNHGYIRQLPRTAEQQRSGGNGIYYHLSYWGTPNDYLWLCSTSPSLISYELTKAYDNGVRNLWIINVGDIKPAEAELDFCMRLAWNVDEWRPQNAHAFSRQWAAETFGEGLADDIAAIKAEYYRLGAGGKPEHVFAVRYTDDDRDARIEAYKALADKVDAVKASVPAELHDAYFELIEYPVKGAYYMNVKTFRAAESITLAAAGQRDKALSYAAEARRAYRMITDLTAQYNHDIAGGKWNGMMDCRPRQQSQFYMPATATPSSVSSVVADVQRTEEASVDGGAFAASSGNVSVIDGLGIGKASATVLPLDMRKYSASDAAAPWVEYDVPVRKGINTISARCLPTFPVNSSYDLRVALSVDGGTPTVCSLKTVATEGKWNSTVQQGFNDATISHMAAADGSVKLRVRLLDPGVVVSQIRNTYPESAEESLTARLLCNPDFELGTDGQPNPAGNICRGIPYGWSSEGTLLNGANGKQSYGINQDAANLHGSNVCWINSVPMPQKFELSQTVAAADIEPGIYRVSCMLWVEEGKKTSIRLFANDNVQYYGTESDYTRLLTPGENNTYAGYAGQSGSGPFTLMPMTVYVEVAKGDDLKIGIRSGNRRNDGTTATDNAGWFKVDNFRIEKVSQMPSDDADDLQLTRELITNYDFEQYKSGTKVYDNPSGTTRRGTIYGIYGWTVKGQFPGDSYGINNDVANPHGNNACWFLPKNGFMPDDFRLQQTIPASKLRPGRYMVCCRLWAEEGYLSDLALFANNSVQYYGMDIDYGKNTDSSADCTFAGYVGGQNGNFQLQDMYVYVDVKEGDDLTIGIRSGNTTADGTPSADYRNGWFKTDFFRIYRMQDTDGIASVRTDGASSSAIYNLKGQRLPSAKAMKRGVYVVGGRKMLVSK